MKNAQQVASTVIGCKPLRTIGDEIEALSLENSKLRANAAYYEKLYRELVPAQCFAWIDQCDVPTDEGLFHETLVKFLDRPKNADAFGEMLAKAHLEWVEIENAEAQIAAKGEY
jgi:hypothetical protein